MSEVDSQSRHSSPEEQSSWTLQEGVALCTAIQELPSEQFYCHPALTGGLLYKQGPRKDCDIVIYQRGDVDGERKPIDWNGLWIALQGIGLCILNDYGYVKKCTYNGKPVDIFDPTEEGSEYGEQTAEPDPDLAMEKVREDKELFAEVSDDIEF